MTAVAKVMDPARLLHAARRVVIKIGSALLVEDETATIYVPPGWSAVEDETGNLVLNRHRDTV